MICSRDRKQLLCRESGCKKINEAHSYSSLSYVAVKIVVWVRVLHVPEGDAFVQFFPLCG